MKICKTCKVEKNLADFYNTKTVCKSCHAINTKRWRDNNKEKKQLLNTNWWYKAQYGISYDDFLAACLTQSNKCKICSVDLQFKGKSNKSAVQDHNHETGELRGILCNACNVGLGHFRDNKEALLNAVDYLKEYEN